MIIAVGTDIVSLSRIEAALDNPAFVDRILTSNEKNREITPQYVAGRWAIKEAVKKCLPHLNQWHQVEVLGMPGQPATATVLDDSFDMEKYRVHISISHEREYATAIAILEQVS